MVAREPQHHGRKHKPRRCAQGQRLQRIGTPRPPAEEHGFSLGVEQGACKGDNRQKHRKATDKRPGAAAAKRDVAQGRQADRLNLQERMGEHHAQQQGPRKERERHRRMQRRKSATTLNGQSDH
mgnify:CR=1 FL=1